MNIMTLKNTEIITEIIPISNKKGYSMSLVTVQNKQNAQYKMDKLTEILRGLLTEVLSHSVRVANIADMLAKQVDDIPDGLSMAAYSHSIWLGCLYHHIGESSCNDTDADQLPQHNIAVLNKHLEIIENKSHINKDIVFDIVRNYHERSNINTSLAARLAGFADTLDELFVDCFTDIDMKICQVEQFIQNKGEELFGSDVIECFVAVREDIYKYFAVHHENNTEDFQ